MSQFHKAERKKGKLRLAIAGPAGAGKTYSALLIAFGIGGRVAMIDTERGSGELYDHLGNYDACTIEAPFEPRKYVEAIRAAEDIGYSTIIIDSLSHAWVGQGGLLDTQGRIADKTGNSWSAWRQVTPKHNELVDTMLQSKCHIIATMRSKMEYTQVEENGKKQVKKLGMSPIQRDGMEYEFTVFMDLDHNHMSTTTKDRTTLFDGQYFVPGIETGKLLLNWLENNGKESPAFTPREKQVGGLNLADRQEAEGTAPAPPQPETVNRSTGKDETSAAQEAAETTTTGMSEGLKSLFARIGKLDLPRDAYRLYCHKRYSVASMTELSPVQLAEQAKILDSLKRPARLKEFKIVLEGFGGNGAGSNTAASIDPAQIAAQASAGSGAAAAGGFNLF